MPIHENYRSKRHLRQPLNGSGESVLTTWVWDRRHPQPTILDCGGGNRPPNGNRLLSIVSEEVGKRDIGHQALSDYTLGLPSRGS